MKSLFKIKATILVVCTFTFMGFGNKDYPVNENNKVFLQEKNPVAKSNPNLSRWYFNFWYEPYGEITPEMRMQMLEKVNSLPSDNSSQIGWTPLGPNGQKIFQTPTQQYSGRIVDIETEGTPSTRIGAAGGGIWGFNGTIPFPLSDNLSSSLNIGSFDSKPGDPNTILVGTGEPNTQLNGTGLYKTINGGASYTNIPLVPNPSAYFKIRFSPSNPEIVHAATGLGYYRSSDGGNSWTRIQLITQVTDLAIHPTNTQIIYAAVWGDGLYKSINEGLSWTKLTSGGIPTTNFGRTTIAIASSNPDIVYVNVAKNNDYTTLGVYRTANSGSTWTNVTPPQDFHSGQGWYNTICGVSPSDPDKIIVGGVTIFRSINGGSSWTEIMNVHVDHHAISWTSNGCWLGNDGGVYFSNNDGLSWSTEYNSLPITQYVIIDVHPAGNYIYGGSQDNGISGTTNGGSSWFHFLGGDGGGMAIDPVNPNKIAITNGVYGGSWAFRRLLTTNAGVNWLSFLDNGIDPSNQWYHRIRNDKVDPVYLYNNSGPYVYESQNYGSSWTKLNTTPFPCLEISNMSVSIYSNPSAVIYACLENNPPTANKLMVYDNIGWYESSTGFPSGNNVRKVSPHPVNNNIAYALMNGFSAGQKIFKTTNRGENWTNITGNLPDLPLADIVAHPTNSNNLYLGTDFGCFKTTNGGLNWNRWNIGMPNATIISEMGLINNASQYFIVASTYGRSMYIRDISEDDPIIGIGTTSLNVPNKYELFQNYPNPFNPVTTIKFNLPVKDNVQILLFDMQGRMVNTILNKEMTAGEHAVNFNGSDLSTGIYFYRMITSKVSDSKKMILIK